MLPNTFASKFLITLFAMIVVSTSRVTMATETETQQEDTAAIPQFTSEIARIDGLANGYGGGNSWLAAAEGHREQIEDRLKTEPETAQDDDFVVFSNGYLYGKAWLLDYLPPEFFEKTPHGEAALNSIKTTKKWLDSLGVHLLVVPVPPRMEVTPTSVFKEHVDLPHRIHFIRTLLEHGVHTLDVLPMFTEEQSRTGLSLSLKTDSHYSNAGVRILALEIANSIAPYTPPPGDDIALEYSTRGIQTDIKSAFTKHIQDGSPVKFPPYETAEAYSVSDANGLPFKPAKSSSILVAGDSYTYIFQNVSGHLPAHLALEMKQPISHVAMGGGGATVPNRLARMGKEEVAKFDVVVWVFTARYLTRPGWDKNPLTD